MDAETPKAARRLTPVFRGLAAWGPGLLVMLADTDAGNVVTAAQAGAQWGYRLLPLIFALAPPFIWCRSWLRVSACLPDAALAS